MKTATLSVMFAGATVGLAAMLLVNPSCKGGSAKIELGPASAAACTKGEKDCLPTVDFADINGVAFPAASLAGKVVVVNFWATWCGPCQSEIPAFSKVYNEYKDRGVVFLGVSTDSNGNNQSLLNFASDYEMSYPIIRANAEILNAFGYPEAIPTTIVYDTNGKQRTLHRGAMSYNDLKGLVEKLLPLAPAKP